MSAFCANSSAGGAPSGVFLSFWSLAFTTRQSATAATPMNTCWPVTPAITASCICCAVSTSMRRTPWGVGSDTGPETSVTSAPASRAARAMA